MKKTKYFAACIAAVMALLVMGCGSGDDDEHGIKYDAEKWVIAGTTVIRYIGVEEDVRVPDGVTVIGESAFTSRGEVVTSVTLPKSVKIIEDNAFEDCNILEITYGGTLAQWCQMGNDGWLVWNATSIKLSDGNDLKSLTTLEIPSGVTKIGDSAFDSCWDLKSVTIPDSVKSIGDIAFGTCTSLASVTIPGSVKSIGDSAFGGCTSLESVTIPASVESIGDWAFQNCIKLAEVTIPDSVKGIGNGAFWNCTSLTEVKYGGTAEQWKQIDIRAVAFPDGVKITDKDGNEISNS